MHLTRTLSGFFRRHKKVPGLMYAGKNRIIPTLTPQMKLNAVKRMLQEEDNIDILSNPYLSMDEDSGHIKDMGLRDQRREEFFTKMKTKNWREHRYMSSHLDTLNITKAWE